MQRKILQKGSYLIKIEDMTYTFFGTDNDHVEVYRWLLDFPGMKLFEDYSRPDQPCRWFSTWAEVENSSELKLWNLAAWSEDIGARPRANRIDFNENTQRKFNERGRTVLQSPAIIKLGRNNDQNGYLANSSISCWTERGARQRSIYPNEFLDEVNWAKLRSTIGKVQRQIAKSAPAKMRSYAIMPEAYEQLRAGRIKLWNWGQECVSGSPLISVT